MEDNHIFKFVIETTKENFQRSQNSIFSDDSYDPYSRDLENIVNLLDENKFTEVVDYSDINLLLSARAHFYKSFALKELGEESDSKSELYLAHKILEGISLTGDGTIDNPYIVTRISDEKDLLSYLDETSLSQSLQNHDNKYFDVIQTESGKHIYFDITIPYTRMITLINNSPTNPKPSQTKKSWWQFWKK